MTFAISFPSDKSVQRFALSSVLVTTFLFYIDEAYYSFSWMLNPGAWLVFLMFAIVILSVQIVAFLVLDLFIKNEPKSVNLIGGTLIGLSVVLATLLLLKV